MTEIERRILQNQVEIMWALHSALEKLLPDFVGRGGELDMMRADLAHASKKTKLMLEAPAIIGKWSDAQ